MHSLQGLSKASKIGLVVGLTVLASTGFALWAHAEVGPTVSLAIQDSSNATTSSASIGAAVHASVSVASTTGPIPLGTVDFSLYSNTNCTGSSTLQSAVALVNGTAQSGTTTVPNTGLSYKAHYNGQADVYPPSDSECVLVTAKAPSVTLTTALSTTTALVGSSAHDSAVLHSSTADATGTVAYTVYTNNSCTLGSQSAGLKSVTNGIVPDSDSLIFNTPGTFYFQTVYSGDANNAAATSSCQSEILTIQATSTPKGHIVVDEVTNPANDPTSFHFVTSGAGYTAFDLTDQATLNNQALNPGTYSISQSSTTGWTLTQASCALNNAVASSYVLGSNLTLNSGDTITCTFVDTKQGTTTPSVHRKHHDDGDNDEDDQDNNTATSTPNKGPHGFFGDFFKHFRFNGHDNGFHFGQLKNGNNGKHEGEGKGGKDD